MKRALTCILTILISTAASAGPTIVESGGFTYLPALRLTSTLGLFAPQAGVTLMGVPPSVPGGVGFAIGNVSSFGAICMAGPAYGVGSCLFFSAGLDTFINAPSGSSVIVRINNSTKATFGTGALLLPSGVDLQMAQGQKHTFDGATGAKYLSSDGTTLGLTGLSFTANAGAIAYGAPPGATAGAVALGSTAGISGIWLTIGSPDGSNYSLAAAGDTLLNAPAGQSVIVRNGTGTAVATLNSTGVTIGSGGSAISKSIAGAAVMDFDSAATGACSPDIPITVNNAAAASPCNVGAPNASVAAGSSFTCWVSSANTVQVRHCCNNGGGTCDPSVGTFQVRITNP